MECPVCGFQKNIMPQTLNRQGYGCNRCSDGTSYPNKFMFNVLDQLGVEFVTEYSPDWIKPKRYDFYFELENNKYIVENNGEQHYGRGFNGVNGRTLQEEQENDRLKKELALNNGIKEENYIVIDCSKSELEFIKNNILNSKLTELFDLSRIDWLKCHEYACDSLVKIICNLWNDGVCNTQEISSIVKMSRATIINNLKKGAKLGWCDYNSEEESIKKNKKQVICLNTKEIFNSVADSAKNYNLKSSSRIVACCKNKAKASGKHPITNEPLKWMYYDDYIKQQEQIHNNENNKAS